jgi:ABC-type multidrug transport system permease subunit
MIALGVVSLTVATLEYRRQGNVLRAAYREYGPFHTSIAAVVAAVISGLGLVGFVLVFLRQ